MKLHQLTRKHKLLMLLIQVGHGEEGVTFSLTRKQLIRSFERIWKEKISPRHLTRLTGQMERDGVLKRHDRSRLFGKRINQAQATYYEIIDAEKGFADLFTDS